MPQNSLKCFGVGDGIPSADRFHSSYLYTFGALSVLIDCGEPISRSFKASGLDYDTIDCLFISHLHSDHVGGLFMLLQGFWLERRRKDLVIYMPADGIAPVQAMLRAAYLFDEVLPFRVLFRPLQTGQPVVLEQLKVTPFPTTHLDGLRKSFAGKYPGDYVACCFSIQANGLRIGHSADLGAPTDLEPLLSEPLDLLVCELAHFRPEELFPYLAGRPIKRILFTHVARYYWERLDETQRLAARMLPDVNLGFPQDQERIGI